MKLLSESYSPRKKTEVGARVLLEVEQEEARIRRSRRAPTLMFAVRSFRRDARMAVGGLFI